MELSIEHLYSEDVDSEIAYRRSNLEAHKLESMLNDDYFMLEDAEDGEEQGIFASIIQKIKNFIMGMATRLGQFGRFIKNNGSNGKLTPEMYLQSGVGQVRLNGDVERITREVEAEIIAERKGVQLVFSAIQKIGTHVGAANLIDEKMIANISDKAINFSYEKGATVIKSAAAVALGNTLAKAIEDGTGLTQKLNSATDKVNEGMKRYHERNMKELKAQNKKVLLCIEKLSYAANSTTNKAMNMYKALTKPLKNFYSNYNRYSK